MIKIWIFLLFPLHTFCQNTIGLPEITNFKKEVYSAGLQNWDIKQDKNGIIYAANNEGLLTFDGKNWNVFPLPNKTIVRSIEIGYDNKIYAGGQDELGYFAPSTNGTLLYHSIIELLPKKDRTFEDVWDIVSYNNSIFIRTTYKIFKYTNGIFEIFKANKEWTYIGVAHRKLFAHDYSTGLHQFINGTWATLPLLNTLPTNDPITAIVEAPDNNTFIATLSNGFYLCTNTGIKKIKSTYNSLFENEKVYKALKIDNERMAIATSSGGALIVDANFYLIQRFSKIEGLQNNNVLSMLLDKDKNLWLGLNNGIDLIAYNSAVKQINPLGQDGSGYTALMFNNQLYLGTTNGLYYVPITDEKQLSFTKANFIQVSNAKEQTWGLANINNHLLLANNMGAFEVKNNLAFPIFPYIGFWNFIPKYNTYPTSQIIGGNYKYLQIFDYTKNTFIPTKKIEGLEESARYLAIDKNENIWVSHPYHGVYKLAKTTNDAYVSEKFTDKQGLPSLLNNHVFKIKNEIVIATEKGIYIFDEINKQFIISPLYEKILGNKSIRYLKEDEQENIWFVHEKSVGVIDYSGKKPVIINLPELDNKMPSGFEFIYPLNENNIFMGGEKGFYHIDYQKYKQTATNLQVQIRKVKTTSQIDEVLFGGYYNDVNETQTQLDKQIIQLKRNKKNIQFQFSAAIFGGFTNVQYSFRLKGFDDVWSSWTNKTEKEYSNLPRGTFHFEVKARNNFGKESEITSYTFKVLPLWYQSLLARIVYFLLFITAVGFLYKWQQNKFDKQKTKFEEEQIRLEAEKKRLLYIHELEINKTEGALAAMRNEKLEAEINFKNAELATSAMHLVKKGELLSKSKTNLASVMKDMDNPTAVSELKKMIKSLTEDDKMDQEWETFSKHFDTVHSDFLIALKNVHPTITGNEMKLCAYLRMNLSTKEIAQLLNISPRGVEIGRYRLRKKLQLPTEMSLFDYLIKIKIEKSKKEL